MERDVTAQAQGRLEQRLVEAEGLGVVLELRLLAGPPRHDAQVAGRPAARHLARIDLVRDAEVDQPARPGGRARGAARRVDAGDAGDQEPAAAQVQPRVQRHRQRRGRGVGVAHAGDQQADAVAVAAQRRMIGQQARHRQ